MTYLAGALYALHDDEEDGDPGKQKAENYPPLDTTRRVHGRRNVEGGAIPEVSRLATLLTFRNCRTVFPFRTTRPWQWTLKYREHFNGLLKFIFKRVAYLKVSLSLDVFLRDLNQLLGQHVWC